MELAINITYIILAAIGLLVIYILGARFVNVINSRNLMQRDIEMYKIKFSGQDILSHLDFIITECLEYYTAIHLTPKNLYYINNQTETEMINALSEIVSARISPTLYSQLCLIYDSNQIASVIGEKIYIRVLEYVIQFNVNNQPKEKNNK